MSDVSATAEHMRTDQDAAEEEDDDLRNAGARQDGDNERGECAATSATATRSVSPWSRSIDG